MKPRERVGHVSIDKAAPTGHSAHIRMPKSARNTNSTQNVGARPAMKLHTEYQPIDIISSGLRPTRSASHPLPVAPTKRPHNVSVNTAVTSTSGTLKVLAIGAMISRKIVKSKASSVQPSHAATQAYHWSRVGSLHQGIGFSLLIAATIAHLPCSCSLGSLTERFVHSSEAMPPCHANLSQPAGCPQQTITTAHAWLVPAAWATWIQADELQYFGEGPLSARLANFRAP